MSGPTPYRVIYSEYVRDRLGELADAAKARGDGPEFAAAYREFHRRLCLYPQFGDPLIDLRAEVGHVRLGTVPPLAMRYAVLEDRRAVFVAAPPVLLAKRAGG